MRRNYHTKLSGEIITGNYDLAYYVAQKCVNYRDTGVSKKKERSDNISIFKIKYYSLSHYITKPILKNYPKSKNSLKIRIY